jgi:hypothetical protein
MRLVIETIDGEKGGHWRRKDLVPHLLPAVIPFLDDPTSIVFNFAIRVIVDRRMTSHYLRAGQLPLLISAALNPNAARYSIYRPTLRVFGTGSLLRTTLLAHTAPYIKDSPSKSWDVFVVMFLPYVVDDLLARFRFSYIWPIAFHEKRWIRKIAISRLCDALRQSSPKLRVAVVEAGIMDEFTTFLQTLPVPDDMSLFFQDVLPGLALTLSLSGYNRQLLSLLRHNDPSIRKVSMSTLLRLSRGPATIKRSLIDESTLDRIWLIPLPDEETAHFVSDIILALSPALLYSQIFRCLLRVLHHREMSCREAAKETFRQVFNHNPGSFRHEFLSFLQLHRVHSEIMDAVTALLHPIHGQPSSEALSAIITILSHRLSSVRLSAREALLKALEDDELLPSVIFQTTFFTFLNQLCTPRSNDFDIDFITRSLSILGIYFDQQLGAGQDRLIFNLIMHIASRPASSPEIILDCVCKPLIKLS